ncbi:MmcB family DNA repair protein [Tanticharoenia sakaeratensis]|uniref:DNA repair protein MmcB-related protein n=1 Tax=Tanticharoenia sakaeratensis NBRC 103193 TaxID=1231623 RepID=A0A0D6MJH6_9PROT|nr:MmcB family DNA repair protein [Tanticharoenia sakaeratensis]GAN53767.1 hypothetical protein Tasa_010_314 [Tanticharoenia sakaeratensis NBRC 103193]GBQ16972.1 hypothetical protein AA103193_0172 [Tanticharoenia sakaeratensis NBRC 103193]
MSLAPVLLPENQLAIRRACLALCRQHDWAPLNEFTLPSGRRCDIMALAADGSFICIEVKSGPRDYLTDRKWPEYRDWSDRLFIAIDERFPQTLLPDDLGIIVAATGMVAPASGYVAECAIIRTTPDHRLPPARRRALQQRFARDAALRLAALEDPAVTASLRAARRAD